MPPDVLIVEDDPIIAVDLEDAILGFGATTVRTAGRLDRGLQLIVERVPDFALLDIGLLGGEKTFAVAERLDALGVGYAFVTGYGADMLLPPPFAARPRLVKPYSRDQIRAVLTQWRPQRKS